MLYIYEYKPPHKLIATYLRVRLRAINIYKEVINRKLIPNFYHTKRLVTSAITQTYHFMIESGLEYGQLTINETIMFLKID
ncbi:hypothetical protein PG994_015206 [Apiospora phragmitis]|uniref:Uncharacterized protein n=1 Tax=Apiospora phragmitis TaxID=2905665 RepID=A0ABR1SSM4_9PEZI